MESTIEEANTYKTGLRLLEKIKDIHKDQRLCGEPRNALLNISNTLLLYLLSILRDEEPILPDASPKISIDEWRELFNALRCHWIIPLLYYKIGNPPPEFHPPGEILDQMRMAFLLSRARSLKMENQLNEIVNSFNRKGIEVIVLKGPALALSLYPDPATRPHCDLDLLVREEDFVKAKELLEGIGYKSKISRFNHLKGADCEEAFIHQRDSDKNIMVELHWNLHMFSGHKDKLNMKELSLLTFTNGRPHQRERSGLFPMPRKDMISLYVLSLRYTCPAPVNRFKKQGISSVLSSRGQTICARHIRHPETGCCHYHMSGAG